MASVFDTIKMKAGDTDRSNSWYRGQVNRIAVVPGLLLADALRDVDLEEFDAAELEPALDEVALGRRAEARQEAVHALGLDDLAEASNKTLVVDVRLQLDLRLDDVHRHQTTVRDRAADATG